MEAAMSKKAEAFFAKVTTLAGLNTETTEFHCEVCQRTFLDIQEKAIVFNVSKDEKKTFSKAQLDFARDIIMKRVCSAEVGRKTRGGGVRRINPDEVIETQCVHKTWTREFRKELNEDGSEKRTFIKDDKGAKKEFNVATQCKNMVSGTRVEIGTVGTRCSDHRKES